MTTLVHNCMVRQGISSLVDRAAEASASVIHQPEEDMYHALGEYTGRCSRISVGGRNLVGMAEVALGVAFCWVDRRVLSPLTTGSTRLFNMAETMVGARVIASFLFCTLHFTYTLFKILYTRFTSPPASPKGILSALSLARPYLYSLNLT